MGYYVRTIDSKIFLDKKHFDDVYKKLCELNDYDELKRGGSYGSNEDNNSNERYNKSKWFSWMDYNYPETCKDMHAVLTQVGFNCEYDDDGNLVMLDYEENKTGNEDYFLSCLAGFIEDGSYLTFKGEEDDDYYRFTFQDGYMYHERGRIEFVWENPSQYEFGKLSAEDAYIKMIVEATKESVSVSELQ
jgi:hypothetical protein